MSEELNPPTRGAIWCARDVALLVTQVAHLKGLNVRQYMRELKAVVEQQRAETVAKLAAELRSS